MEFCGRCGTEVGRGLERGRFCRACGHEAPGNARYPLYADGTAAVTRPRPVSVAQQPAATAVVPRVRAHVATPAPVGSDVTRPRLQQVEQTSVSLFATAASSAHRAPAHPRPRSRASWGIAVATMLLTMVAVVLVGLFLLTR
jgi:hypothetical protein